MGRPHERRMQTRHEDAHPRQQCSILMASVNGQDSHAGQVVMGEALKVSNHFCRKTAPLMRAQ